MWEKIVLIFPGYDCIAEVSVVALTMEIKCVKHRSRLCTYKGWDEKG